jgi:large subunit ribosomal protein L23
MSSLHPMQIIDRPILSEESTIQTQAHNKYIFRVRVSANKRQIREAVEAQWPDVQVAAVNTMNYDAKAKGRRGTGRQGTRSKWKKAIVTLRQGDTIELI